MGLRSLPAKPVRLLAALLLGTALVAPADARMHAPYRGHRIVPANAAALDGFTTPSGAYSFRKLRSAYAGAAVKLQRVDTTTLDVGFVGNDFDTAAATAFCTTACTVNTWYDQSGLGRHLVQATAANQPAYIANCTGTLPCARTTGGQVLQAGSQVTPAGPQSISAVARVDGAAQGCIWLGAAFDRLLSAAASAAWVVDNSTATISQTAALAAWHAGSGVINGAASVINIDGSEATGTVAVVGTTNNFYGVYGGGGAANCSQTEAIWWNGYALTTAERTGLQQNQKNYWMPAPLDTFATPAAAYSLRKLKSNYSGPAIRVQRASDTTQQDIGFVGFVPGLGSPLDVAAANAFCASTICTLATWYDQSGNARHTVQANPPDQPSYVADCGNGLPCARVTLGASPAQGLILGGITAANPLSLNAVAKQTTRGSAGCREVWYGNGNELNQDALTDKVFLSNGGTTIQGVSTTGAWHSHTGVMQGAGSAVRVDGTEVAGSLTPNLTAGNVVLIYGAGGATCDLSEAVAWSGYALSPGERTALQTNQKSFWGTP